MNRPGLRLGIDLGGTKVAGIVLTPEHETVAEQRLLTPAGDYAATLQVIAELVATLESSAGAGQLPIGIGTPGSLSPFTGLLRNANSTCLNNRPIKTDIETALGREVRMANDADCLAVSEAIDGAGAGADSVFAVILGTGVGGGVWHAGRLLRGPNAIAGEWGHNPLPWPDAQREVPGPSCWCGRTGCIETWLSGPALAADYRARGPGGQGGQGREDASIDATTIVHRAGEGETLARQCMADYEQRLARALAMVINMLDPDVIVLGGGLSQIDSLYTNVPALWDEFVFSDQVKTRLQRARHGDASGVRGAAWLN